MKWNTNKSTLEEEIRSSDGSSSSSTTIYVRHKIAAAVPEKSNNNNKIAKKNLLLTSDTANNNNTHDPTTVIIIGNGSSKQKQHSSEPSTPSKNKKRRYNPTFYRYYGRTNRRSSSMTLSLAIVLLASFLIFVPYYFVVKQRVDITAAADGSVPVHRLRAAPRQRNHTKQLFNRHPPQYVRLINNNNGTDHQAMGEMDVIRIRAEHTTAGLLSALHVVLQQQEDDDDEESLSLPVIQDDVALFEDSQQKQQKQQKQNQPPNGEHCVPMIMYESSSLSSSSSWQRSHHRTCNTIHELSGLLIDDDTIRSKPASSFNNNSSTSTNYPQEYSSMELLSTGGSWRMAWIGSNPIINIRDENIKIGQQHETPKKMEQFVLKMLRYDIESSSPVVYENHRKDAVAMEQLTASPHVMDVYGFCGHSVVTEVALGDSSILLKRGMNRNKKDDDDYYGHPKEEQTLLSSFERLVIARDVAQGLMDIHRGRTSVVTRDDENSYGGGEVDVESNKVVMVHNDINPANVVTVEGGRLKFNDFNLVEFLDWNVTSKQPCGFPVSHANAAWKAPEEIMNETGVLMTPKVDIYGVCNILYQIMTSRGPYKWLEKGGRPSKEKVKQLKLDGIPPYVPSKYRKSPSGYALYSVVKRCFKSDPKDRPSSQWIVKHLNKSIDTIRDIYDSDKR